MPDVKMWYNRELTFVEEQFLVRLKEVVAREMSCFVPDKLTEDYKFYTVSVGEIDIPVLDHLRSSDMAAVIEVSGFPYENRMLTIKQRLKMIAAEVAKAIGVSRTEVSITFIKVGFDCWTTGN